MAVNPSSFLDLPFGELLLLAAIGRCNDVAAATSDGGDVALWASVAFKLLIVLLPKTVEVGRVMRGGELRSSLARVAEGAEAAGILARLTLLMLAIVVENDVGLMFVNDRFSVNDAKVPSSNRSCPFALNTAKISSLYFG